MRRKLLSLLADVPELLGRAGPQRPAHHPQHCGEDVMSAPVGLRRCAARLIGCRAGATAVEMALLFPVLSLLLYGGMETARAISLRNSLQFAVERGARCAVIAQTTTCDTPAHIIGYTMAQVYGAAVSAS